MNKVLTTIVSIVWGITSLGLLSCDDKEDFILTGVDGCPSSIRMSQDESLSFAYKGKQLSKIKGISGYTLHFRFENGELISRITTPQEGVMDGNGETRFIREGNKIKVESSGEPSFDLYTEEIELNESDLPTKITQTGLFGRDQNGLTQIAEGRQYTLFTYDASTQLLTRQDVYSLKDSSLLASYTYEYDQKPGLISRMECPLWHAIWVTDRNSFGGSFQSLYFLNYRNNVTQVKVEDKENNLFKTISFNYTYNSNGFPIRISGSEEVDREIKIQY